MRNCCVDGCSNFTDSPLSSFSDSGWQALSVDGGKAFCLCPTHKGELTVLLLKAGVHGVTREEMSAELDAEKTLLNAQERQERKDGKIVEDEE